MKYSQIFIIVFALAWVFLPLTAEQKIVSLGFIAIYLGIHNFVGFRLAEKGITTMRKLNVFKNKLGGNWGPWLYLVFFVLLPTAIGLYVLFTGISLYFSG